MTLPSLFVSHGSPMHALEPGAAGAVWKSLGERLGKPEAILIASAHWETLEPTLTGSDQPETIHDFSGFPDPLYRIRYAARGAPALARRAKTLLGEAGFAAAIDEQRGLDHGAWVPLLHARPAADVPVLQISVQAARTARHHLALGAALAPLADEGVLVVGSGHMTHNLRDWMMGAQGHPIPPYAREFQSWVEARIAAQDLEALAEYRGRAPHGLRAHPSEEHFLPLFVALGAAGARWRPERLLDEILGGVLAMDAYLFHRVN